jgi:hypothetical protein
MKYIFLSAALLLSSIAIAETDPFVGTWSMKVSASKYAANELPKSMHIVMESLLDGIHYRSETTHRNDRVTTAEYTADYDGRPAMVIGNIGMMAPVTLKRIDAHTVKAEYVRGLQIVATSRRTVSKNERIMTITTVSYDEHHHATTNVGVYERVSTSASN